MAKLQASSKLLFLAVASSGIHVTACQLSAQATLSPPVQQKVFVDDFRPHKASFPLVSGGFVITYSRVIETPDASHGIFLSPLADAKQHLVPFWVSGASVVHIDSVAVDPKGEIIVVGAALMSSSEVARVNFLADVNSHPGTNFISKLAPNGSLMFFKDLDDYTPERVCASEDGTIWLFGQRQLIERAKKTDREDYFMLRHYDSDGKAVGAYMSRSSAERGTSPNYRQMTPSAEQAYLVCSSSSAAAVIHTPSGMLVTTVDPSANTSTSDLVHSPPGTIATGMTMLAGGGDLYGSFATFTRDDGYHINLGGPVGVFKLSNSKPRVWEQVSPNDSSLRYGPLLGSSDQFLLHLAGTQLPVDDPTVYWTRALPPSTSGR